MITRRQARFNLTAKVVTIYDLPPEIIIQILGHLPLRDVNNASLASKHWLSSTLHPSIMKKRVLKISEYKQTGSRDDWRSFVYVDTNNIRKSTRSYYNIKICCNPSTTQRPLNHYLLTDMDFWKRMAKSLKFLEIDGIHDGDWQNIFKVLSHLKDLESLCLKFNHINKGSPSSQSSLFDGFKLKKLTYIELYRRDEAAHNYLPSLLGIIPEIIHFHLTIRIAEDKLFDVKQQLFNYLNDGKNRIKSLQLDAEPELIKFILTLRKMNLESIQLYIFPNEHLNYMGLQSIESFTDKNKLLQLRLSSICFFELNEAVDVFPNLQIIEVDYPSKIMNNGPVYLKKSVNNQSIVKTLMFISRSSCINYKPGLCLLSRNVNFKNMGNLTKIVWPNVEEFLNDEVLQNIFRYLTQLKHIFFPRLRRKMCFPITDYGFTGERENLGEIKQVGYSISNLTNLRVFDFCDLSATYYLGDRTLFHFSKLKQLGWLRIACINASELGVENLKKCCPKTGVHVIQHVSRFNCYDIVPIL